MKGFTRKALVLLIAAAFVLSATSVTFAAEKKQYVLGINNYMDSFEFCWKVHSNIEEWAKKYNIKTVYTESAMEPERVKANLDSLAMQGVDAIFEFNWLADVTAKWMKDNPDIVMVTGDYKVDGAYYFGANQHEAGLVLGRFLAGYVKKNWGGRVDAFILCGPMFMGDIMLQRMGGIVDGYKETYPKFSDDNVFKFENSGAEGQPTITKRIVTDFYTAHPKMTHIVVGTNNDEGGLGTLAAIETMGKEKNFLLVSHGGDTPFHEKIRAGKGNLWLGSVAYMPERYGEFMIPWLKDVLDKKPGTPMEMSPKHFVLTKDNLDKFYPKK
jgi:ribose transport system substrate-binding protein